MLQEKISTTSKLSQLQVINYLFIYLLLPWQKRDYDKAEEECQRYRTLYDSLKHEVRSCDYHVTCFIIIISILNKLLNLMTPSKLLKSRNLRMTLK